MLLNICCLVVRYIVSDGLMGQSRHYSRDGSLSYALSAIIMLIFITPESVAYNTNDESAYINQACMPAWSGKVLPFDLISQHHSELFTNILFPGLDPGQTMTNTLLNHLLITFGHGGGSQGDGDSSTSSRNSPPDKQGSGERGRGWGRRLLSLCCCCRNCRGSDSDGDDDEEKPPGNNSEQKLLSQCQASAIVTTAEAPSDGANAGATPIEARTIVVEPLQIDSEVEKCGFCSGTYPQQVLPGHLQSCSRDSQQSVPSMTSQQLQQIVQQLIVALQNAYFLPPESDNNPAIHLESNDLMLIPVPGVSGIYQEVQALGCATAYFPLTNNDAHFHFSPDHPVQFGPFCQLARIDLNRRSNYYYWRVELMNVPEGFNGKLLLEFLDETGVSLGRGATYVIDPFEGSMKSCCGWNPGSHFFDQPVKGFRKKIFLKLSIVPQ